MTSEEDTSTCWSVSFLAWGRQRRLRAWVVFSEYVGAMGVVYPETICPEATVGWDDNWANSNYYGQVSITGGQYPGPCSSLFPLLSMQVCSTALTSAAGNTTNAHKPSHPCSLTMASETSDSTPSLTATVMPGWQQAERARGSGGRAELPSLRCQH